MPPTDTAIRLPLSSAARKKLAQQICASIRDAEGARKAHLDRIEEVRTLLKHRQTRPESKKPWPNASDVAIPLSAWTLNRYAAQILGTVMSQHPIFNVEGQRRIDDPHANNVEQFLEGLCTQILNLEMKLDPIAIAELRDGSAAALVDWNRIEEPITRRALQRDENGVLAFSEQTQREVTYDGPEIKFFPVERFGVYPPNAPSVQQAEGVYLIDTRTGDDLLRLRDAGYIAADAIKTLQTQQGTNDLTRDESVKYYRDINAVHPQNPAFQYQSFEIYVVYWRVVVGKDKPAQDWLIWIERDSETILCAEPNPAWSQKRPLILFRAFPDPEGIYGDSIGEMVYDVQEAMTAILRQSIDDAAITIHTPVAMDETTRVEGEDYQVKPGGIWRVWDVNKIKPIVQPSGVATGLGLLQYLTTIAEKVTGVSDLTLGVAAPGSQTATESQAQESNAAMLFNMVTERFRASMGELAEHLLWQCYQYAGNESVQRLWERLVGEGENPFVAANDAMGGRYYFTAAGTTANSSIAMRRAIMREVYERLMQNPLVQANPLRMFAVTKRYLAELGFRVPEELLGKEQEVRTAMATQARAQQHLMALDQQEQDQMRAEAMLQAPAAVQGAMGNAESNGMVAGRTPGSDAGAGAESVLAGL